MGKMKRKIMNLRYKIFKPRYKTKYQFGSPIIGLYAYQDKMIVATKIDLYITEDGITYVKIKPSEV